MITRVRVPAGSHSDASRCASPGRSMAGGNIASALSPAVQKLAALPIPVVVATKRVDGSVQLNPVWFELKDGFIWLNSNTNRSWPKNLQRDPELTMLLVAPKVPDRSAQIR